MRPLERFWISIVVACFCLAGCVSKRISVYEYRADDIVQEASSGLAIGTQLRLQHAVAYTVKDDGNGMHAVATGPPGGGYTSLQELLRQYGRVNMIPADVLDQSRAAVVPITHLAWTAPGVQRGIVEAESILEVRRITYTRHGLAVRLDYYAEVVQGPQQGLVLNIRWLTDLGASLDSRAYSASPLLFEVTRMPPAAATSHRS